MPPTGFLLGKFLPPHRGHLHLIEFAQQRVEHLTVLVCSIAREPIPGALRFQWVRELYPTVNVQHCSDELPQTPADHPDFWALWRTTIQRYCPNPSVVFSSETYGDRLAQELGARHVMVDLARQTFPVSGTVVRADPRAYWHLLPPAVQAYYAQLEQV